MSLEEKRRLIDPHDPQLSISRQCELLAFNRSSYYYGPATETENLALMRLIDEEYTRHPVYGRRRMTAYLKRLGHEVNSKRIRRLMQLMGLCDTTFLAISEALQREEEAKMPTKCQTRDMQSSFLQEVEPPLEALLALGLDVFFIKIPFKKKKKPFIVD